MNSNIKTTEPKQLNAQFLGNTMMGRMRFIEDGKEHIHDPNFYNFDIGNGPEAYMKCCPVCGKTGW